MKDKCKGGFYQPNRICRGGNGGNRGPATLSNLTLLGNGGFQFTVQANAIQTTLIQATTNVADPTSWTNIATNPPTNSSFTFTDADSILFPARFYRAVSP